MTKSNFHLSSVLLSNSQFLVLTSSRHGLNLNMLNLIKVANPSFARHTPWLPPFKKPLKNFSQTQIQTISEMIIRFGQIW